MDPVLRNAREWVALFFVLFLVLDLAGAQYGLYIAQSAPLVQLVRTVRTRASLVNIQARSIPVQPTTLLWGVDSCKPLTGDPTAAGGLYAQVRRWYGSPDFWGRYLTNTDNCPGISTTEIAAAAYRKMGILPIYVAAMLGLIVFAAPPELEKVKVIPGMTLPF